VPEIRGVPFGYRTAGAVIGRYLKSPTPLA
jgi:hypothetical protein